MLANLPTLAVHIFQALGVPTSISNMNSMQLKSMHPSCSYDPPTLPLVISLWNQVVRLREAYIFHIQIVRLISNIWRTEE